MAIRPDIERVTPARDRAGGGWAGLFVAAFRESRNAMVLVDESRKIVDVNGAMLALVGYARANMVGRQTYDFVAGGPMMSPQQWNVLLDAERFTGDVGLVCADGSTVGVQWAATSEVVTGRHLVLCVALSTSRWGGRFRRPDQPVDPDQHLSSRELEVLRLVASGRSGPEIADELRIAHNTVRTHVRNAMTKTGARSRAHLVAKALAEGHALR